VAQRKKTPPKRGKNKKTSLGIIFWFAFVLVMGLLFVLNWPIIKRTLADTHLLERLMPSFTAVSPEETPPAQSQQPEGRAPPPAAATSAEPSVPPPPTPNEAGEAGEADDIQIIDEGEKPAAVRNDDAAAAEPPTQTRSRMLYFIRIDNDGTLVRAPAKRELPATGAPLYDTLDTLLRGPSDTEKKAGLTSLIPGEAHLISCAVRGDTAFVNFDEAFMFNTYGAEGYMAQLRQIVWTATEFPNVKNVQILIEGNRIDYLGENIRINAPIARSMY
jgi:hypothetical protein